MKVNELQGPSDSSVSQMTTSYHVGVNNVPIF